MKHVLITGCSSGIGRYLADNLQARDYRVYAAARKQADVDQLQAAGLNGVKLDLNDSASIHSAVEQVLANTDGQLHALINNAAYGLAGAIEDLSREDLSRQFDTNVIGTQELTNLVIPVMRRQQHGRIIQISSMLGFMTMRFRGAYCASKYAMESLSDAMRYELHDSNIHVSLIQPGPIRSEFRSNMLNHYRSTVNRDNSVFKEAYTKIEKEMDADGYTVPFTLGPEAVLAKVLHALNASKPKARYRVTVPSHLFAVLKHLLPAPLLDQIIIRI